MNTIKGWFNQFALWALARRSDVKSRQPAAPCLGLVPAAVESQGQGNGCEGEGSVGKTSRGPSQRQEVDGAITPEETEQILREVTEAYYGYRQIIFLAVIFSFVLLFGFVLPRILLTFSLWFFVSLLGDTITVRIFSITLATEFFLTICYFIRRALDRD